MEKSPFAKLDHVGMVVRDFDRVVDFFQSLGIGPFQAAKGLSSVERMLYGKPIALDSFKLKEQNARVGAGLIQIIQPVEGKSVWKDTLDARGDGVQHLGFIIDDIEKEEAKLVKKGLKVLYRSRFNGGGGAAYFDTSKIGGVLFEIVQWPPQVDLGQVLPKQDTAAESTFGSLDHVGVVVRDMDKAVEHYQSLGIGPFEGITGIVPGERSMRGKPVAPDAFRLNEKMAWMGPIRLQLQHPAAGESIWKEFLDTRGEGVSHISFRVKNVDQAEAKLLQKGLKIIYRSRWGNGGGATNFDTYSVCGVLLEVIQWPSNL